MKKISAIITLIFCLNTLDAQHIDTIPAVYQFSTEKPILIKRDSRVYFNSDSIYLINPGRYKFYEDLRVLLNYDIGCGDIITAYQNSIEKNGQIINDLLLNSKESERLNQKMLLVSNNALNYSFTKIAENDKLISEIQKDLNDLQKLVKKDKRRKIVNYFIIGISGTVTGILITKL